MSAPHAARTRAYLAARTRLGMKFGLQVMDALCAELGHPERAYRTLLVAGTNGKGSVSAYVDAALRASRLRTGRYTSPHLVRVNERIAVGGRLISDAALARAVDAVRAAAERLVRRGVIDGHPTFFEVLTAAAFVHFARARVDVAVLEVGLGGRLDATNLSDPAVSAIVSIARDHEAWLGHALSAIAREKAGVLRAGRTTVIGALPRPAAAAVAREAARTGARLREAHAGVRIAEDAGGLIVRTPRHTYRGLRPLPGAHQRENLLVALALLEEARSAGIPVDLGAVPRAVAATRWPGRLQWIPGRPRLLLDGAHNPAGADALRAYLRGVPSYVLLFGVMSDKHVEAMAHRLFPGARAVILTEPPGGRAATPPEIARRAGRVARHAEKIAAPGRALRRARALAGPDGVVVVAGSLYLVGDVLRRLEDRRSRKRR